MSNDEILTKLRQSATAEGTSQYIFSSDMSTKQSELEILKELESEGYIQQLSIALGYAIYRVL